jgi:hypothetical protein
MALLAVLWTIVLLASVAGTAVSIARRGMWVSTNRLALARARWAAAACIEILQDAVTRDSAIVALPRVDLGRGVWCVVEAEPAGARLDLDVADSAALAVVLGRPDLVAAVLDWRDEDDSPRAAGAERTWYEDRGRPRPRNAPFAHPTELRLVAGFEDSVLARILPLVGVRVDAPVPLLAAPRPVLATLPGLTPEAIDLLLRLPGAGAPGSLEEIHALLSPSSRIAMLERHTDLTRATTMVPEWFDLRVRGAVDGSRARCEITLRARVSSGQLHVARRVDS